MKRAIFLLFAVLFVSVACAQSARRHFFLSLDQSLTIPVGQFGDKTYSINNAPNQDFAGMALPGFHFSVTGGYQLNSWFSVIMQTGYGWNRQDKQSIEDFSDRTMGTGYDLTIKNKSWGILKTLAGVGIQKAISSDNKFYFQLQAMAGVAKTSEPGFEITGVKNMMSPNPGAFQLKMAKKNLPAAFAWQGSAGLGYQLDKNVFLLMNISYFDARPAYKYNYIPPPINPGSYPAQPGKFQYSLSHIGLNVSAGWRFN